MIHTSTYYLWTSIGSIAYGLYSMSRYYSLTGVDLISGKQAKKMIKTGQIKHVIDIRTTLEWKTGHYKGAIHIPVQSINEESTKKIKKEDGILAYCNTGQRARVAAEKLKDLGFKNVFYIDGTYSQLN